MTLPPRINPMSKLGIAVKMQIFYYKSIELKILQFSDLYTSDKYCDWDLG